MIETITLITLSLLLMSILRPGKTPPLESRLCIERQGQYHMTLSPMLNLAQPFIEAIALQLRPSVEEIRYSDTQYFEVRDKQLTAHGHDYYLLAITQRNGLLYFQASSPQSDPVDKLINIAELAHSVLKSFPAQGEYNAQVDQLIIAAIQKAAQLCEIEVTQVKQGSGIRD